MDTIRRINRINIYDLTKDHLKPEWREDIQAIYILLFTQTEGKMPNHIELVLHLGWNMDDLMHFKRVLKSVGTRTLDGMNSRGCIWYHDNSWSYLGQHARISRLSYTNNAKTTYEFRYEWKHYRRPEFTNGGTNYKRVLHRPRK